MGRRELEIFKAIQESQSQCTDQGDSETNMLCRQGCINQKVGIPLY